MLNSRFHFSKGMQGIFSLATLVLLPITCYGCTIYTGSNWAYLIFSIVSHSLLILGLTSKALFFDVFIGVFLWLGFWLKFTLKLIFNNAVFSDPIGYFDGSPFSYDHALLVASVGLGGLILATSIRRKFFKGYLNSQLVSTTGFEVIYKKNRVQLLLVFIGIIVFVGATNLFLGIYQKGTITRTFLPLGINGIYKWLLIFGLASFSAVILDSEFRVRKDVRLISVSLSLFETFFSSVSMLSRGMILNSSALILGLLIMYRQKREKINLKLLIGSSLIFLVFFIIAQQVVGVIRNNSFLDSHESSGSSDISQFGQHNHLERSIFVDRWVGIEGVMAVSSYPDLGEKLFQEALDEKYNEKDTSFYDKKIVTDSPYVNTDKSKHHFLSLPGIIAFLYYSGSYLFVFTTMFFIGVFSALLEWVNYKLTHNLVLVSLMAQVVAYRLSNFGYVPSQTYQIFCAILLNVALVYLCGKFFKLSERKLV